MATVSRVGNLAVVKQFCSHLLRYLVANLGFKNHNREERILGIAWIMMSAFSNLYEDKKSLGCLIVMVSSFEKDAIAISTLGCQNE